MVQPLLPYELTQGRYGPMLANKCDFFIGHALIRYGEYGEGEMELLRQFIRGPGTIVEIGGNNGSMTVALAQAAARVGADVVVFEPQPFLFQNLCANLALNALDNVVAWPFACGAERGVLGFERPDYRQLGNFGRVSMSHDTKAEQVKVPCVRADDMLTDKHPLLFKIDVEGFELEALQGASETIARCRPVIFVENDRPDRSVELIKHLWAKDYILYWHVTALYNKNNYRNDPENIYDNTVSCNMLCAPKELNLNVQGMIEVVDLNFHPFAHEQTS
ncbi:MULTISPECIES: FkbM family methyltransferase [Asaia]|uniref:Methyltransferase FkbM n=1 Tax=Asaia bogorensis TaxID=91915 RepID=A0A060QCC4_9PROT|nr:MULTISPECIES: FkbM family methyltransferase [Asaia]ETC98766.1 SAM-dependent methyltransferase [Asaia sp. SF2.1]CDG38328.1 Methyltransferase FkbM [Asaia bogorensis]